MGNVVMFPAHKARKPKTPPSKQTEEQANEIKENIFIEQLVEEFTLDFIHVLQENAITMKNDIAACIKRCRCPLGKTSA